MAQFRCNCTCALRLTFPETTATRGLGRAGAKLLTKAVAALSPDDVIDNGAIKARVEALLRIDYETILTDLALGNQLLLSPQCYWASRAHL